MLVAVTVSAALAKHLMMKEINGGLKRAPGGCRIGVLSPSSVAFEDECEGCDHFGETMVVFEEADDEVGGSDEVDGSGWYIIQG